MESDALTPVQLPDLAGFHRHPEKVDMFPVYYTYKEQPETESIPVCPILVKYLLRRLKFQDKQTGGILGASDGVMTHYFHDHNGQEIKDGYYPAYEDLNWIIAQWKRVGIDFGAVIHGHPPDAKTPTAFDLRFMAALLTFNPQMPSALLGIVADDQLKFFRFDRDFLSG